VKIAFATLGCKLNQYDTELLKEMSEDASYEQVDFNDIADTYIINACSVTMNALQQTRNIARRARKLSREARIILTGCFPASTREVLKEADTFVSNSEKESFFRELFHSKRTNIREFADHTRAFVKIQSGCNRFCSYCIVPYLRGKEHSRNAKNIIEEIKTLVNNGYKEITLTGVHIGRYKCDGNNLTELLRNIDSIDGLKRVRLGSLNPEEITDSLLEYISTSSKVCHHLHISLQSGDKNTLKRMGRNYSPHKFAKKLLKIKAMMPDCGIGADIITGFPSEGPTEFQNIYDYLTDLPFTYFHIFRYSPRKTTLAAILPAKVKEIEKKRRSALLRELGLRKSIIFRERYLGKKLNVLVEEKQDRLTGMMIGFSGNYIRVLIDAKKEFYNQFVEVRIDKISGYDTYARITNG